MTHTNHCTNCRAAWMHFHTQRDHVAILRQENAAMREIAHRQYQKYLRHVSYLKAELIQMTAHYRELWAKTELAKAAEESKVSGSLKRKGAQPPKKSKKNKKITRAEWWNSICERARSKRTII